MEAEASKTKDEEGKTRNPGAMHYLMEYAIPSSLILLAISLVVLFFVIGPVAVFKFILSFLPKNPGMWHAIIMCSIIVVSIVLPTPLWPPLMIVAAMVFGFWYGFLIDFCAMVLGAVISFALGRFVLQKSFHEYIETSDHPKMRRMIRVVEAEGNSFKFTFLFRFLYLPIWIRNYVPSMLYINFWHFLVSVLCHSTMICFIFASTGTATKDMSEVIAQGDNPWAKMNPKQMLIFAVSFTATMTISCLAYREYSNRLAEEDAESLLPNAS